MSCNTSFFTKGNCNGRVRNCNGCKAGYCEYHYVAVQACRAVGGHVCEGCCTTSAVYVQNCKGGNDKCPGCNYRYCQYHFVPCRSITDLVGGHICSNTTGNSIVSSIMDKSVCGLSISDVNGYLKTASTAFA